MKAVDSPVGPGLDSRMAALPGAFRGTDTRARATGFGPTTTTLQGTTGQVKGAFDL